MQTTVPRRKLFSAVAAGLFGGVAPAVLAQRRGFRGGFGGRMESLPQANSDAEKKILGVLDEMQRAGGVYLNVPASDGRMLRLLAESTGAKSVAEIGTSTGTSGLWFSLALQKTGGRLTTFELDHGRATTARENFQKAGVAQLITVIEGDAHQNVSRLSGPIDVVFIDADKEGYPDYLKKVLPLTRPGGLILAHNVNQSDEYDRQVVADPALDTIFFMDGGGLGITLKKR
jgi:caffeoyl-CoA O-methyltransferase